MTRNLTKLHRLCIVCVATLLATCLTVIQGYGLTVDESVFPIPENLKPNIQFWIKVYTLYTSDQVIIHDSENLERIYKVVDTNEILNTPSTSSRTKWREVDRIKNQYKDILLKLASLPEIEPDKLDNQERMVYTMFGEKATPSEFQRAASNIRGQQGLRDHFRKGLIRSGMYADHIKKILEENNLPADIIALPHVESSFNYQAYSKFGAAGIWQFTRSTGRLFLKINYTVDERFDPLKSTEAAAKLLKENYEILGTWPLAITAYNHGVNGMKRAVSIHNTQDFGYIVDNYESRNFKFASKNFYAEFLAAIEVRKNYRIYFGELVFDSPKQYLTFTLPGYVKLATLEQRLDVSRDEILDLNPSLRRSVVTSQRRLPAGFELRIPYRENFDPEAVYAQIPTQEKFQDQVATNWYQVESGDNLQDIARRYKMTVAEIMDLNEIQNPHQLYEGQVIRIKAEETVVAEKKAVGTSEEKVVPSSEVKVAQAEVKEEAIITRPSEQKQQTGPFASNDLDIEKPDQIAPAVQRALQPAPIIPEPGEAAMERKQVKLLEPGLGVIYVQPEETLGHYADWLKIPTQELRDLNNLDFARDIQLGQKIKLVFREVTEKDFQRKRMEFHRGIEEDFFATFRVEGVVVHKIRRGENIWYLCNQVYEIPYWLVLKYNPNIDLVRLTTKDELIIPIVESITTSQAS